MRETSSVVGGDGANALLVSAVTTQHRQPQQVEAAVPPTLRRGRSRVREISSRFMSPLVVSNSNAVQVPTPNPSVASESQRSKSVQGRMQQQQELEVEPSFSSCADKNFTETAASFDINSNSIHLPLGGMRSHPHLHINKSVAHKKKMQQQQGKPPSSVNKENDVRSGTKSDLQQARCSSRATPRPDTPVVASSGADRDRIVASRYRFASRPTPAATSTSTAAAKLLQDATKSTTAAAPLINYSNTDNVHDPSFRGQNISLEVSRSINHLSSHHPCTSISSTTPYPGNNRTRSLPEMRCSMPEVDPTRWHAQPSFNTNIDLLQTSSKFTASPCSRSPNLSQANAQNSSSSWISVTSDCEAVASTTPTKTFARNNQVGSFCLPPHPDATRKGRKLLFNHQEDVHSLKLLKNHYLQWRFANAKAEFSMVSQQMDIERQFYSLGVKMSDMRDSVKRMRIELGILRRIDASSTIAEYQMPYLNEWAALEENYSTSISGVIDALCNLSLRLPVSGVKIGATELGEILDSAEKVMEMIVSRIESFMVKAEEIEILTSEIARVMGRERAHVHDCRDYSLKAYASQVEECSLRGHLIQLLGHKNYLSQQERKISL